MSNNTRRQDLGLGKTAGGGSGGSFAAHERGAPSAPGVAADGDLEIENMTKNPILDRIRELARDAEHGLYLLDEGYVGFRDGSSSEHVSHARGVLEKLAKENGGGAVNNAATDVEDFIYNIDPNGLTKASVYDYEAIASDMNRAGIDLAKFDGSGSGLDEYLDGTTQKVWGIIGKWERTPTKWDGSEDVMIKSETNPWLQDEDGNPVDLSELDIPADQHDCVCGPVSGVLTSMDTAEGIQRCDQCQTRDSDLAAAQALSDRLSKDHSVWFDAADPER